MVEKELESYNLKLDMGVTTVNQMVPEEERLAHLESIQFQLARNNSNLQLLDAAANSKAKMLLSQHRRAQGEVS